MIRIWAIDPVRNVSWAPAVIKTKCSCLLTRNEVMLWKEPGYFSCHIMSHIIWGKDRNCMLHGPWNVRLSEEYVETRLNINYFYQNWTFGFPAFTFWLTDGMLIVFEVLKIRDFLEMVICTTLAFKIQEFYERFKS